jgi:ribosome-associated protein
MKHQKIKPNTNDLIKSRTTIKNESSEVTTFAKNLVGLTKAQINKLPLSENSLYEIFKAQGMQKIALKRQIGFISKILRSEEIEELQQSYDDLFNVSQVQKAKSLRLETLRDTLINCNTSKEALNKLIEDHSYLDIQYIRQLIRNAQNEKVKEHRSTKYSREIFQYIKKLSN